MKKPGLRVEGPALIFNDNDRAKYSGSDQPALQHGSAPQAGSAEQHGSAPQAGSAQQLEQLPLLLLARRPKSPRRRGFAQQAGSAPHAGSAAQQAGSAAPQAGSAAQQGSAAQAVAHSQLPRLRRPAADAESTATKPTTSKTAVMVTNEEKRFIEKLLSKERQNRIAIR